MQAPVYENIKFNSQLCLFNAKMASDVELFRLDNMLIVGYRRRNIMCTNDLTDAHSWFIDEELISIPMEQDCYEAKLLNI